MKKHEIENCIRKYLLPNFPSYEIGDEYVMYKQFGNGFYIKGYTFISRGDKEFGLTASYLITPLFQHVKGLTLFTGGFLCFAKRKNFFSKEKICKWDSRFANSEATFTELGRVMGKQAEPFLNKTNSPKDIYNHAFPTKNENIRDYEVSAFSSILFATKWRQDKLLKGLIKETINERDADWVHIIRERAEQILGLDEVADREVLLKKWSNETMDILGYPHLERFKL